MSAEQDLSRSGSTVAVILGASNYPMSPQLAELPAAANSAGEFTRYLAGTFQGLSLPYENVLILFDSAETPINQLRIIDEWLTSKQKTLKDLIVFYSGRAGFTTEIRRLFLATRMTTLPWEGATSIDMEEFYRMLELNAGSARKYLIFDCVFSGRALLELAFPFEGRTQVFPSGNTAVLLSSFSGVEVAPRSEYTPFSGGLFDVVQSTGETLPKRRALSVDDVARRVRERASKIHGERPDLYTFGDLIYAPFFPTTSAIQFESPGLSGLDKGAGNDGLGKPADKSAFATQAGGTPLDEDVQFTVYRPREIQPRRWYKMLVFTHLDERPAWLEADELSPLEQVEEEAQRILGPRHESYRKITDESRLAVPRDGEITFVPKMPGIVFNPPTRNFLWKDGLSVHLETFELRLEQVSAVPGIARGHVTVFLGHLILAEVAISIRLREVGTLARDTSESISVRRFRRIFASYSHKDLKIVKEMERYSSSLGDRYLSDWVDIRAGERWDERLLGMISEADIFQLFWSWNAAHSPYVEREWRHAYSLRRETFIRPTYWEDPWPPPPEPLLPIQFQRLKIVSLHGQISRDTATTDTAESDAAAPEPHEGFVKPVRKSTLPTGVPPPTSVSPRDSWGTAGGLDSTSLPPPATPAMRDSPQKTTWLKVSLLLSILVIYVLALVAIFPILVRVFAHFIRNH